MTDRILTAALAAIRARADAATEGPWEWEGEAGEDRLQFDNSLIACRGTEDPVLCAWGHDAYGIDVGKADAEFIAHARTDLPALLAAVEAVLELHDMGEACPDCGAGPRTICECGATDCQGCSEEWPCPTVRALTAALEANTTTREDQS